MSWRLRLQDEMSSVPENVVLGNTLGGVVIDIICFEVIPEQLPKLALIPSLPIKSSLPEKVRGGKYLGNLEADITWETVRFEHFSMFIRDKSKPERSSLPVTIELDKTNEPPPFLVSESCFMVNPGQLSTLHMPEMATLDKSSEPLKLIPEIVEALMEEIEANWSPVIPEQEFRILVNPKFTFEKSSVPSNWNLTLVLITLFAICQESCHF